MNARKITAVMMFALLLCIGLSYSQEDEDAKTQYYFYMYTGGSSTFLPGEDITISMTAEVRTNYPLSSRKIRLSVYEMDENMEQGMDGEILDNFIKKKKPIKEWTEKVHFKPHSYKWHYEYPQSKVKLNDPGYYLIYGKFGNKTAYALVNVTGISAITKTDAETIVVFVQDLKQGTPIKGATVAAYREKKEMFKGKTNEEGILDIPVEKVTGKDGSTGEVILHAAYGDSKTRVSAYTAGKSAAYFKAYISTDRPIYRPEQKVYFKGILRMEENKQLAPAQNEDVDVIIKDTKGNELYKEKLKSNLYGSVSGELTLSEEPDLGNYSIVMTVKGQAQYGAFKVEEYRKPEYEIIMSSPKNTFAQNEKLHYDVEAKYYFGAPVIDAPFKYTITRSNYYPYYRYYHYWWIEDEPYYGYGGYGQVVSSGEGKTDAQGKAAVVFMPEKFDYDATYTIYVQMTDSSRKEVSSSQTVKVTRAQFFMSMLATKYYYKLDEEALIKIHAQDYDGKPVKTEVSVDINHVMYDYKKGNITTLISTEKAQTDENGNTVLHFTPRKEGSYSLTAKALDVNRKEVTASAYFVASDSERLTWVQATGMDIIPDKPFYEAGDEAKFVVQCPVKDAYALLTVEGDKIYEKKLLHFDVPALLITLKIKQEHTPNIFVSITFIHAKTYYAKTKEVSVPAMDKFLSVRLSSDKGKYEPRETAKYLIKTQNNKGNPESAEVALALADESVFAIAEDKNPSIQKFFYGRRSNVVYTYNSIGGYSYYPGEVAMDGDVAGAPMMAEMKTEAAPKKADKGKDGDEGGYAPTITRTYFPDTAYFNPFIITDEKGEATVNVILPDSLTTWRANAIAATLDTKVGNAENKIIVSKKLLVRLELPRFANEKDVFTASAVVHNYLSTQKEVLVELKADGAKILADSKIKIQLKANGEKRVDWKVEPVAAGGSKAKFTVSALSDEASDAMELPLPVLPHGTESYAAESGDTKTKSAVSLLLPESSNPQTASLRIMLSPSIASTVFSALEYLVGYPYGCVEQTMSRFLPTVIVAQALKKLGMENEKIEKDLPEWVSKGLGRLYNFHHSDGGWGWWENDESHPYMTAYVIFGLTQAKNAGFRVDESKISAGVAWLKNRYEKEKDLSTQTYMLYALSVAGEAPKDWIHDLYDARKKLNAYSQALVAVMLYEAGEKGKAKEILSLLERSASQSATIASWKAASFEHHSWMDNEVESTAYVLKAFLTIEPENPMLQKIIRFLSHSRQGNYWVSTKDTAAAIFAITQYLQYSDELNPNFKAKVTLNGKFIKEVSFTKDDVEKEGKEIKIAGGELATGKNQIVFEKEGDGRLYFAAYLKFYSKEENVKSSNSGFKVSRAYQLISEEGGKPVNKWTTIKSGDRILVTLTLTADSQGQYVLIEDPKPAGCEIVDDAADLGIYGSDKKKVVMPTYGYWNYWFSHKEVRDEKIAYFATNFYSGTQTIQYVMRAETPGTFHTMPTRVSLMYAPEVGGAGSENIVVIKD